MNYEETLKWAHTRSVGCDYVYTLADYAKSLEHLPGSIVECGSYKLGSAIAFAAACPQKTIYACDTFSGMPRTGSEDGHKEGDFGDLDWQEIVQTSEKMGNIKLVRGVFEETLKNLECESICLVYIDCDLYQSARVAVEALWPKVVTNGLLVVHDYSNTMCGGIKKCMDEMFEGQLIFNQPHGFCLVRKC